MWEPRRLKPLYASAACYRDIFTFFAVVTEYKDELYTHSMTLEYNISNVRCYIALSVLQVCFPLLRNGSRLMRTPCCVCMCVSICLQHLTHSTDFHET
jgi:hypothetical protein